MLMRFLRLACVGAAIAATALAQPSPTATPPTRWMHIELAVLADTGEQIAVLDFHAFRTVEALKDYIATLPTSVHITFRTYHRPPGENKFAAAAQEIKTWSDQHHVRMMVRTRPAEE